MKVTLQFSAQDMASGGILAAIGSWLICWWTWCDYSHVDIVVEKGGSELWLGAKFIGGFKYREPYRYARATRKTFEASDKFILIAEKRLKTGYNWLGLIGIFFRQNWTLKNHEFCDQAVLDIAHEDGVHLLRLLDGKSYHATQADLLRSPLLADVLGWSGAPL